MIDTKLKEYFEYNPITGDIIRIKKIGTSGNLGLLSVRPRKDTGYLQVTFMKRTITLHRLAWFLHYGFWPDRIDHKNGDKTDNKMSNLRICTRQENRANSKSKLKFKGVTFHKRNKKYQASIKINSISKYLGQYNTPEDAHAAYKKAAKKAFKEFARFK